ncbi:MAG: acetamidase/formamidase family protein [Candidatus Bathyarchaeia archaeon]
MKKIFNTHVIYEFSKKNNPVLEVDSGERVVFDTLDALGGQIKSERDTMKSIDFTKVNPATGPIYVKTACPGDALVVEIEDINIGKKGIMLAVPGLGILGDKVTLPTTKIVPIVGNKAVFSEYIALPIRPMIGVIGVAPAADPIPCGTPGDHGGNMDTKDIAPGAKVYLPVFVNGALLAMGDVHAVMGDGEACGTGIEIAATVTVKVDVVKAFPIRRPIIETKDSFMTVASGENLEDAVKLAVEDMVGTISKVLKISFEEAYMLTSAVGDAKVSQMVDPQRTARLRVSKEIIQSLT